MKMIGKILRFGLTALVGAFLGFAGAEGLYSLDPSSFSDSDRIILGYVGAGAGALLGVLGLLFLRLIRNRRNTTPEFSQETPPTVTPTSETLEPLPTPELREGEPAHRAMVPEVRKPNMALVILRALLFPWTLPKHWPKTDDMTDEELVEEALGQKHLLRAVGWFDSAIKNPFIMNWQYIRCCQYQGKVPAKPYVVLYAMVVLCIAGGAVIMVAQLSGVSAASYSSWQSNWLVGALIGAGGGAVVGFITGPPMMATMQFRIAYSKAWFYEPAYVHCETCDGSGKLAYSTESEEEIEEEAGGNLDLVAVAVKTETRTHETIKCWACGGHGEVELLEGKEAGWEYVLRMATITNSHILFTGSGAAAGFTQGDMFLKAPRGYKLAELDNSAVISKWESAQGRFVGENDRETRNKYSDAEETGKRRPWRSGNAIGAILKEWSGVLLYALSIGFIIVYVSMTAPPVEPSAAAGAGVPIEAPASVPVPVTPGAEPIWPTDVPPTPQVPQG